MTRSLVSRPVVLLIATLLYLATFVASPAATPPARAAGCAVNGYLTANIWGYGYTGVTAKEISGCDYIQARMDRYYAGSVRVYYSAWNQYGTAYVSSTNGVFSGGFGRGKVGGTIYGWTRIYAEPVGGAGW